MYNMNQLKKLKTLGQHQAKAMKAFQELSQAAFAEGEIPVKYKELIAIGVAISKQCVYCMESHKQSALKAGATEAEIAEATFIASAIGAGAAVTHGTHLIDDVEAERKVS